MVPSRRIAEYCRSFLIAQSPDGSSLPVRLIQFVICPEDKLPSSPRPEGVSTGPVECVELHIVLFPSDAFPLASKFWQHTGLGISSRLAERCLNLIPPPKAPSPTIAGEMQVILSTSSISSFHDLRIDIFFAFLPARMHLWPL